MDWSTYLYSQKPDHQSPAQVNEEQIFSGTAPGAGLIGKWERMRFEKQFSLSFTFTDLLSPLGKSRSPFLRKVQEWKV